MNESTATPTAAPTPLPHSLWEAKRGPLPWIILGIWLLWLAVLAVMAFPEITVSKEKLIPIHESSNFGSDAKP
jgi:hypothetical protein